MSAPVQANLAGLSELERFRLVNALCINEQAHYFIQQFFGEFEGQISSVLSLAEDFKRFAPREVAGEASELDEFKAHMFLERQGDTKTVKELRAYLKEVDVDNNCKVSFLEHALYEYKKTVPELLAPTSLGDPAIERCAAQIQEWMDDRAAFAKEEQRLEADSEAGGSIVARRKAALDLQALRKRVTVRNRAAVKADSNERATKKAADRKIKAELASNEQRAFEAETLRRTRAKAKIVARSQAFRVDTVAAAATTAAAEDTIG